MDNVCHSLAGVACARAGFTRPARLAVTTSLVAANLPDLDVLVFATSVPSVAFRRGWTHGVLAQVILPAMFAGLMFQIAKRRGGSGNGPPEAALGPLLVLSYIGVISHVFLDCLNNYGVRLLMPFSGRWFYGDSLFIVDPWLWILFGAAVLRRGQHANGTRICLAAAIVYILCMMGSARAARAIVAETWRRDAQRDAEALMVGPVPINPLRRTIILDAGDRYHTGTFEWFPARSTLSSAAVMKNDRHPAVAAARRDPRIAAILVWARFPFWDVAPAAGGTRVTVRDMRFVRVERGGFTATTIVE